METSNVLESEATAGMEQARAVGPMEVPEPDETAKLTEEVIIRPTTTAKPGSGMTPYLGFCSFFFVIGSSFLYGYNVGDLNTPAGVINETFFVATYSKRQGKTPETADEDVGGLTVALWQVTIALFVAGGAVGSFGSSWFCEKLGRRTANIINQIPFILSGIVSGIAKYAASPELLMAGRFLAGLGAGAGCTYVPVYLTEIAPTKIRGAIATLHQLAITLGILVAQVLSLPVIWGNERLWPVLVGFVSVPAFVSIIALPFCVESPRYLYINKNDLEGAKKALQRLRGKQDVEDELEEMASEKRKQDDDAETYNFKMFFKDKSNRLPLAATVALQVLQQWSGINAVFFYSALIFKDAGVADADIPYAVVLTGAVNVLVTIIAVIIIEKAGRRKLILIPCLIIALIYLLLTACLVVKDKQVRNLKTLRSDYKMDIPMSNSTADFKEFLKCSLPEASVTCSNIEENQNITHAMSIIAIICIIIYIISFAVGIGPIPHYITSEIFQQAPRTTACAIAQGVNWTCNLILSLTFLYLQRGLESFTFVPFLAVVVTIGFFVFIRIPETKGKSFEEISEELSSVSFAYHRSKYQSKGKKAVEMQKMRGE